MIYMQSVGYGMTGQLIQNSFLHTFEKFCLFNVSPLMTNCTETATRWARFIAERPEFAAGEALLAQFSAGKVTRLCECGCNSFNLELDSNTKTAPIAPPSEKGQVVFLAEFTTTNPNGSLEFILYANAQGNFDGLDVHFNGNTEPIPESFTLSESPYHVYGILAREG